MTDIDQRIVHGARCKWWDSISKAGTKTYLDGISLPCCPHCGGILFEISSWEEWMDSAIKYEQKGNPGYVAELIEHRGKCNRASASVLRGPPVRFG